MRALLLIWLGCTASNAPALHAPAPSPPVTARSVEALALYSFAAATDDERRMFELINHARRDAGMPALVWNEPVSAIAHATSVTIRDQPDNDSLRRIDYGELTLTNLSANLARAGSVEDAEQAWLDNARERTNLLSPDVTQIGLGIAETDEHIVFGTAIVFGVPARIDAAAMAIHVGDVLASRDRANDPDLRSIADAVATKLAAGETRDDMQPFIQSRLRTVERKYVKIRNSLTKLPDGDRLEPDDILVGKLLAGQPADDFGVGIAQAPHPETGHGAVWLVVIFAELPPESQAKPFGGYIFSPR